MASSPPLGEFARIARFFAPLAAKGGLGLKDDVALIEGRRGEHYVLKADAIVEGIHFFSNDPPADIARKLLRVNLSDLAAKGATPVGYLLTTALPKSHDDKWLAAFARGLKADQKKFGIALYGGDSSATHGPAMLSVAAIGRVKRGQAILRSGAKPGDLVYVTGTLGDAALGLDVLKGKIKGLARPMRTHLVRRYRLPEPRLDVGRRLVGLAHASADISDGLIADLGHICNASGIGAEIDVSLLPLSSAARTVIRRQPKRLAAVYGGGDDYEIVFAAPPDAAPRLNALSRRLGIALTAIGWFRPERGVVLRDGAGRLFKPKQAGYRHF